MGRRKDRKVDLGIAKAQVPERTTGWQIGLKEDRRLVKGQNHQDQKGGRVRESYLPRVDRLPDLVVDLDLPFQVEAGRRSYHSDRLQEDEEAV